ncbi:MAG: sensor histidine kinase [Lachnospiraceae bacterium]
MIVFFRYFFVIFITTVPHYILCCIPFFSDLRVKKCTVKSIIIASGIVMSVCYSLFIIFVPGQKHLNELFLIFFYVIYLIMYRCCFRLTLSKIIYIFLMVQTYSTMLNVTAKFIDVQLFPAHEKVLGAVTYGLIACGLMLITYPFLFRFFKNTFSRVFHDYPDSGFWRLCIIPALFSVVNMMYSYIFHAKSYTHFELFILYLILLMIGMCIYYLTLHAAVELSNVIKVRTEMESQLALQSQRYLQLSETVEQSRVARHDLRHHLSVLSGYVKNNNINGLQEYLREYIDSLPDDTIAPYCQNYAVDAVANYYLNMAKAAGTELDIKFKLPRDAGIPDSDLCIVFGNVLENAAESCKKQHSGRKFIKARCDAVKGRIILVVNNSGSETSSISKTGKYKGLGVGLRSVQAVAEKWGGSLKLTREGDIYKTSVIMMFEINA